MNGGCHDVQENEVILIFDSDGKFPSLDLQHI